MNKFQQATYNFATACDGSPVSSTVVVMLFYVMFTVAEQSIEKFIFGERFAHFLDPVFAVGFIAYAAYAVYYCAVYNASQQARREAREDAKEQNK